MIRYSLVCKTGHSFESWFADSAAYDRQAKRKLVTCPHCGSAKVEKAIMAPRLATSKKRNQKADAPAEAVPETPPTETPATETPATEAPGPVAMVSPQEQEFRAKLKELRDHLVKNADHVGNKFPEEARKMHYGEIEHRSIYGAATREEAAELIEEGIDVHPLPVLPEERN
ncbi:MAG: DUF1178 family protein [Pseudolabrys sp.]